MKVNPERIARASSRHPWRTVAAWGVIVVSAFAFAATGLGDVLTNDIAFTNKPESIKAQDVLDGETHVVARPPATYYDLAKHNPDQAAGLVSKDHQATLIPVVLVNHEDATANALRSLVGAHSDPSFITQVAGQASLNADFTKIAEEDAH